jgi:CelD/BcsL family acetyltransferase involved in cellulose biosynthesis
MKTFIFESPSEIEVFSQQWRKFESKTAGQFFQTWLWVGSVFEYWNNTTTVRGILVENLGQPIIMCLLYSDRSGREWSITEPASRDAFALGSEYNAPLIAPGLSFDELKAAISALTHSFDPLAILRFNAVPTAWSNLFLAMGYRVDVWRRRLAPIQTVGTSPARTTNSDGEWVRRMRRCTELYAPVSTELAVSPKEKLAMFEDLVALHGHYWRGRGKTGVFCDEEVIRFHKKILLHETGMSGPVLFRLRSGHKTIAILYNFRHQDCFYAYQSGIMYDEDNRKRPGLLAHTLFLNYILSAGGKQYNMLAGDPEYKRVLTNTHEQLEWLTVFNLAS